jgi:ASC-1-like (ASCH) protein
MENLVQMLCLYCNERKRQIGKEMNINFRKNVKIIKHKKYGTWNQITSTHSLENIVQI